MMILLFNHIFPFLNFDMLSVLIIYTNNITLIYKSIILYDIIYKTY